MRRRGWDCSEVARRCLVGASLVLLVVTVAAAVAAAGATTPSVAEITQAEILVGDDGAAPPPDSATWQPVVLPDRWRETRPNVRGTVWYRMQVDLPDRPQEDRAALVEWRRSSGSIFVNGVNAGHSSAVVPRLPVQLFELPAALLHPGRNTLHVRMWIAPQGLGELASVHVGARRDIDRLYAREQLLRVTLPQFSALTAAALGVMMLVIWLGRRHDTMFGWFAVAALSNALYTGSILSLIPGLEWWGAILLVGAPMYASLSIYCLRLAVWQWPRFELILWGASLALSLSWVSWALWKVGLPEIVNNILFFGLFAAPLVLSLLIAYRKSSWEAAFLAAGHLANLSLLASSALAVSLYGIDIETVSTLPVFLVMALILSRRFVRSLNEAETLNAELAARVEAKRLEIETKFVRLAELEKQEAVVAERTRLMRDMHDGIGGQLISTLSLVEAGEATSDTVAAALRECIDDLRLTIDSLEPTDNDLVPVLGNLRYRVEPRLKARGISLDWQVCDLPRLACMTPQNVLHVLRILQEAFTNVLKHAGARHIRVHTRSVGDRVLIDIQDDGKGLGNAFERRAGRGLTNMRQRAQAIGGELSFEESMQGTTITIGLPVGAASSAPG
jgi:signal transduction histidine kinase